MILLSENTNSQLNHPFWSICVETNRDMMNISVPTGSAGQDDVRITSIRMGNYEIRVRLGSGGEFLGIESVEINRDFLDYLRKIENIDVNDVEKYYVEE